MATVDKSKPVPVSVASLTRWDATSASSEVSPASIEVEIADNKTQEADADGAVQAKSPFPVDQDLNNKIILWRGDLCSLDVDAIVNTTSERLNSKSGIAGRIMHLSGPVMKIECDRVENCPTGDAVITRGCDLIAKHVIHTVGPRFSLKYQTAAENALHGCYRRSLEELKDTGLTSVAFCVVNTERKQYPKKPAAHIAFRTVRKFLSRFGSTITTVVFCVDNHTDWTLYSEMLPLYFPRTLAEEEAAVPLLPSDLGNELGETVIEDRKIRIGSMPAPEDDVNDSQRTSRSSDTSFQLPPKPYKPQEFHERKSESIGASFTAMQDHPDDSRQKRDDLKPKAERVELEEERLYNRYLREANETNLTDMQSLRFIYEAGKDVSGRPVIAFVACNMPEPTEANMHRAILYMLKVLDPIVACDFNIIYFHSLYTSSNKPPYTWIKQLYTIFNRKYKKNMKRLFIVHPSFWTKMAAWFAKPFVSKKVWKKIYYITMLREIYEYFEPTSLKLPEKILQYDMDLYGDVYAKTEGVTNTRSDKNQGL